MQRTIPGRFPVYWMALLLIILLLAACGGGGGESAASTPVVVPTMPPARFTAVAEQSVAKATSVAPKVEALTTPTADASVSRGELVYTNKKCGDCHGPAGEGVDGKGKPLAGTELNFQKFEDILRTGGGGSLGRDHQYGPSAISPSGMTNLFAFVSSLGNK